MLTVDPTNTNSSPGQRGGRRPGAGRKGKGKVITIERLKAEIDLAMGQSFESVLGEMALQLFQDFKGRQNVSEAIKFMQMLAKYLIEQPVQQVAVAPINKEDLPDATVDARVAELLQKITFKTDAKTTNNP